MMNLPISPWRRGLASYGPLPCVALFSYCATAFRSMVATVRDSKESAEMQHILILGKAVRVHLLDHSDGHSGHRYSSIGDYQRSVAFVGATGCLYWSYICRIHAVDHHGQLVMMYKSEPKTNEPKGSNCTHK